MLDTTTMYSKNAKTVYTRDRKKQTVWDATIAIHMEQAYRTKKTALQCQGLPPVTFKNPANHAQCSIAANDVISPYIGEHFKLSNVAFMYIQNE